MTRLRVRRRSVYLFSAQLGSARTGIHPDRLRISARDLVSEYGIARIFYSNVDANSYARSGVYPVFLAGIPFLNASHATFCLFTSVSLMNFMNMGPH